MPVREPCLGFDAYPDPDTHSKAQKCRGRGALAMQRFPSVRLAVPVVHSTISH